MTEDVRDPAVSTRGRLSTQPASIGVAGRDGEAKSCQWKAKSCRAAKSANLVQGTDRCAGYWQNDKATAETFIDGWGKPRFGKDRTTTFVYIVDRAKDMLIRGGENIYCVEVENALYDHPAVMDAAVIGRPHLQLGEEPLAVVHLKPGTSTTSEDLRHHCAQKIAAFKVPVDVIFWPETLPRNANGKIVKTELKKRIENPEF